MKTEKRTLFIGLRKGYLGVEMIAGFNKPESNKYWVEASVCEIEIEVPVLSDSEKNSIILGFEIEHLQAKKITIAAEARAEIEKLDQYISELTCLEHKVL